MASPPTPPPPQAMVGAHRDPRGRPCGAALLREDFVRPLRQGLESLRAGEELPREMRLWPGAMLVGSTVGQPGGMLFRLRLSADPSEAEE